MSATDSKKNDLQNLYKDTFLCQTMGIVQDNKSNLKDFQVRYLELIDYHAFEVNMVEKWIGFYLWVYGK